MPCFPVSCLAALMVLAMALAVLLSPRTLAHATMPETPTPDHVMLAFTENHPSFSQIIDDEDALFIQDLARRGALFT